MQKFKKALKKLAGLGQKSTAESQPSPQLAKKAPAAKKKTQVVAAAKKPVKKPVVAAAKKPVIKIKPAAAAPKAASKVLPKTPAAAKAPAPAKIDAKKKTPLAPVVAKAAAPHAKPATPAKNQPATLKSTPKKADDSVASTAGAAKAAAPAPAKKAPLNAEAQAAADKKAKGKKDRADADLADAAQSATTVEEEIVLTDADGRRYCRVKDCDQAAAVGGGYCRFHYLLFWKNIQNRKKILSEGKLERYVEELTARYPDKYLDLLRKDLRSEKDFTAAIQELEIDESAVDNEMEDEAQNYLDEVRGMSSESQPEREEDF